MVVAQLENTFPEAADIDVHALHSGYLRLIRARGGCIVTGSVVNQLKFVNGRWQADTSAGQFSAPIVVNAAGAWADAIAGLADIPPVGIEPRRRTVILVDKPPNFKIDHLPFVVDIDEQFYFKPETGFILASAAGETPSVACDAQPEELDVAIAADRLEQATTVQVNRIYRSWAGLRSFSADRTPVVGFQLGRSGFFWLAGQGGYGIQTAPAMARLAAALLQEMPIPTEVLYCGVSPTALIIDRMSRKKVLRHSNWV